MSNPPSQFSSGARARAAEAPGDTGLPDALRLQGQLASLDFLCALLNARAMALLPVPERADLAPCVVDHARRLASSVAAVVPTLEPRVSAVQPVLALGADASTLAVPMLHEDVPLYWLLAQFIVPDPRTPPYELAEPQFEATIHLATAMDLHPGELTRVKFLSDRRATLWELAQGATTRWLSRYTARRG